MSYFRQASNYQNVPSSRLMHARLVDVHF